MKWAEVIMVRSAGNNSENLDLTLETLMDEVEIENGDRTIRVFRHEKLKSDICIVLFHNQKKTKAGGSILGLHLVAALKEIGLVNHTIWYDQYDTT